MDNHFHTGSALKSGILREKLNTFLYSDSGARENLRSMLKPMRDQGWSAYLFGGLLRDLVWGQAPRDVDLVVADEHIDSISQWLPSNNCYHNRFGGLKVKADGWEYDIWPISKTWAFEQSDNWPDKSFKDLPSTTFLNVEAVAMELWPAQNNERKIYENGFYEAFERRILEINYAENPYPDFCIARSLFIAAKLRFTIGPNLTKFIDDNIKEISVKEILTIQKKHYKFGMLSEAYLVRLLDHIRWNADWQSATQLDELHLGHYKRKANPFQLEIWPEYFWGCSK